LTDSLFEWAAVNVALGPDVTIGCPVRIVDR